MLLVMDVGNSHTVLGLYEGEAILGHWRIVTSSHRTSDELRILLLGLMQQENIERTRIRGCCISSVVPAFNQAIEQASHDAFGIEPLFIGPGVKTGLVIQVENPKEVGADRIANAVGAMAAYSGALIVVDFGTATTFDAITSRGEFRGGVIVPGVQISADALFERCAKLPHVDICAPPQVIGRDTISNIRSGLTYGYADLVDGLIARIADEMGEPTTVVATGGLSELIAKIAKRIEHLDPLLTLTGLKLIFERNMKERA